jgi:hypothetical protein
VSPGHARPKAGSLEAPSRSAGVSLLESFSDDAVVNFDGAPHAGRAGLLELYGRVLGPLIEACTHSRPNDSLTAP